MLRANGLGDAAFGAEPEGVVAYVSAIIGNPTVDTGWVDPLSVGACPGTEFRQVFWGDLVLQFSDVSNVTNGRRHFFSYVYGPAFVQGNITPAGLKTEAGIGVGSTVQELQGTYPTVVINPGRRPRRAELLGQRRPRRIPHGCDPRGYGDISARRAGLRRVIEYLPERCWIEEASDEANVAGGRTGPRREVLAGCASKTRSSTPATWHRARSATRWRPRTRTPPTTPAA